MLWMACEASWTFAFFNNGKGVQGQYFSDKPKNFSDKAKNFPDKPTIFPDDILNLSPPRRQLWQFPTTFIIFRRVSTIGGGGGAWPLQCIPKPYQLEYKLKLISYICPCCLIFKSRSRRKYFSVISEFILFLFELSSLLIKYTCFGALNNGSVVFSPKIYRGQRIFVSKAIAMRLQNFRSHESDQSK